MGCRVPWRCRVQASLALLLGTAAAPRGPAPGRRSEADWAPAWEPAPALEPAPADWAPARSSFPARGSPTDWASAGCLSAIQRLPGRFSLDDVRGLPECSDP